MPGVGFVFWGHSGLRCVQRQIGGVAKKGKVICYDVGRVLAPAADGRSYCNRTACRHDAGVIGTHLRTDVYKRQAVLCSVLVAVTTFVICVGGFVIGRTVGDRLSGRAEVLGGAILVFIGLEIFIKGVF